MDEEATSKLPMTFVARCGSFFSLLRLVSSCPLTANPPGHPPTRARYRMGDILGKGAFSTVRLATSKVTNKKWAVKAVGRKDLPQTDEDALRCADS